MFIVNFDKILKILIMKNILILKYLNIIIYNDYIKLSQILY